MLNGATQRLRASLLTLGRQGHEGNGEGHYWTRVIGPPRLADTCGAAQVLPKCLCPSYELGL